MYEDTYGTDWEEIDDREEAVERAYALGVAAQLGERYPDELERLVDAVPTTYDRSFVELAYQKGRDEARARAADVDTDEELWEELVEPEPIDDPETYDVGHAEFPDSLEGFDVDTLPPDTTEALKRPTFMDRFGTRSKPPSPDRTSPFGRSRAGSRRADRSADERGSASGRPDDRDARREGGGTPTEERDAPSDRPSDSTAADSSANADPESSGSGTAYDETRTSDAGNGGGSDRESGTERGNERETEEGTGTADRTDTDS
ncbi:hypothetical protein ACFQGT_08325 [Natrialbaceae archaeon GCM10025810]|uniref:hypothetical protein n=1 Tax=Halovalidus salilacus TaxID=3075124 RepID=UPI00360E9FA8